MRAPAFAALLLSVVLIPTALGVAKLDQDREASQVERSLRAEVDEQAGALEAYYERARANVLLTANSPAFAAVLAEPGTRAAKVRRPGRSLRDVVRQLGYLEQLYPSSIGEACFIDAAGGEFARVVRGEVADAGDLSTEEAEAPFFAPAFALRFGDVHQTRPYVSPDTDEWVIANATLIPQADGRKRAIAHFEVTVESFRKAMSAASDAQLRVIDGRTGAVVIDGATPQRMGAPLGLPGDRRFATLQQAAGNAGLLDVDGRRTAFRRVANGPDNANAWIVVATAPRATGGFVGRLGPAPIAILAVAFVIIALAGAALRSSRRELERDATTDALTGLGNRRKLLVDIDRAVRAAVDGDPVLLAMFDLNGFKSYNDNFGHPAGDALLQRLGCALQAAVRPFGGRAYRPGGDEFCVIAPAAHRDDLERAACAALAESGEGFAISTAFGTAAIPDDATNGSEALRAADAFMYAQKQGGRPSASRQSSDVLLRALAERHPDLAQHNAGVTDLVEQVGRRLGVVGEDLAQLRDAAALHDIGKVAIPDTILAKPGPLDDREWAFMRRHTVIGERILSAAPALSGAAQLVRSSHEAWDGSGYPDRLAGADIPLGARIIAVCDAFDAMVSQRPYAPARSAGEAMAELRRCAGAQFDPRIVDAFAAALAEATASPVAFERLGAAGGASSQQLA